VLEKMGVQGHDLYERFRGIVVGRSMLCKGWTYRSLGYLMTLTPFWARESRIVCACISKVFPVVIIWERFGRCNKVLGRVVTWLAVISKIESRSNATIKLGMQTRLQLCRTILVIR